MCNREAARKLEMFLIEKGYGDVRQGEYITTRDALTGDQVICRLGHFKGVSAAAMMVGEDAHLICLTRDFIELVLNRSLRHSRLGWDVPEDDSPNYSKTIDPYYGVLIEAALINIEGEELIELFLEDQGEPVILEPGFLVELMFALFE